MANIQYFEALGDYGSFYDFFDEDTLHFTSRSSTLAVVKDDNGNTMIFKGTGFKFKDGLPIGGTVTGGSFIDAHSDKLATASGLHLSAKDLLGSFNTIGLSGLLSKLISGYDKITGTALSDDLQGGAGKDVIKGLNGDDMLDGGTGNDTLTGGKGTDFFEFHKGYGRDTITDFDAVGGGIKQDYIGVLKSEYAKMKIVDSGKDVDLIFGNGDHLILKNVDHHDISSKDFILWS